MKKQESPGFSRGEEVNYEKATVKAAVYKKYPRLKKRK